jgi:FkbM family methyltransferase
MQLEILPNRFFWAIFDNSYPMTIVKMTQKYQTLIQQALSSPPPVPTPADGPVLVYGMGRAGQEVASQLASLGFAVAGFLDRSACTEQRLQSIPGFRLEDWLVANRPTTYMIVIGLTNRDHDAQIPVLQEMLKAQGFRRVLNFLEFHLLFPDLPIRTEYYLAHIPFTEPPQVAYAVVGDALDRLEQILYDEKSRQWLEGIVRFRLIGDYAALPPPSLTDQYHPSDLPAWPNPLRLIDCGAYTGDTLMDLAQNGYTLEAIAAFEPDPENFARLVQNTASCFNITRFPCALGARTENIRFAASADSCSHISVEEGMTVQCVQLDDVVPTFRPNLIKMDIEGAEPDALEGARRMIAQYRPGLAISVYHEQNQLWRIPLLIDSWNLNYRFYLRGHDVKTIEAVLYAYPAEWLI